MKKKLAIALALVLGLVLLTGLPAVAEKICEAKIIEADCESFTLFTDSYPGTIDFTLVLSQGDCSADNIVVSGSVQHGDNWVETVELFWKDFCFDDTRSVQDVLTEGEYTISGCATLVGSTAVCIPPRTFLFDPCPEPPVPPASCEDGKPEKLIMRYFGEACPDPPTCDGLGNDQECKKVKCEDFGSIPDTVFIIAANKDNLADSKTKIWFSGFVEVGGEFTIDATNAGKNKLDADTRVFIFDADPSSGGDLVQKIKFHTSCSQLLNVGDIFGTLEVVGFIPETR